MLFLELQLVDSDRDYGLTRSSFEALTRAALRDTTTENRLTKDEICARVAGLLKAHNPEQVTLRVENALNRLSGSSIRHRKDKNEYHLTDAERSRISTSIAELDTIRVAFEVDILKQAEFRLGNRLTNHVQFCRFSQLVIETYLMKKGEEFARAVSSSVNPEVDSESVVTIATNFASEPCGISGVAPRRTAAEIITTVLKFPSADTSIYVGRLLEAYTFFAFLELTPDVRKATQDMFVFGKIWLDASVLLPLLAEEIAPAAQQPFTSMFKQARAAGIELLVTLGMIEEVERHLNRSKSYANSLKWDGYVPHLYTSYIQFGGHPEGFNNWTTKFIGPLEPMTDVADYLRVKHNIKLSGETEFEAVTPRLRQQIRDAWLEIHNARRDNLASRLAEHDSELYLHVLSSRIKEQGKSILGHSTWWLTFDRAARTMTKLLANDLPIKNFIPVISTDFLVRYMLFGPNRAKIDHNAVSKISFTDTLVDVVPPELLSAVKAIRENLTDLPEYIIQRNIRDTLNSQMSRAGSVETGGLDEARENIKRLS